MAQIEGPSNRINLSQPGNTYEERRDKAAAERKAAEEFNAKRIDNDLSYEELHGTPDVGDDESEREEEKTVESKSEKLAKEVLVLATELGAAKRDINVANANRLELEREFSIDKLSKLSELKQSVVKENNTPEARAAFKEIGLGDTDKIVELLRIKGMNSEADEITLLTATYDAEKAAKRKLDTVGLRLKEVVRELQVAANNYWE